MDFLELAKSRYSCRRFSDRQVEDEKIEKLLEAARLAPTAVNFQPQRIIVVKSEEALNKLKKGISPNLNPTLAFIISYDKNACWVREYDG
ncbi:MAG: nitroreductase family protein, partial [Bacilli bacterium]|nr:nitroreductase family protein [Bacilli bacterium]